jgi:arabinose-5-phosphate isomerase
MSASPITIETGVLAAELVALMKTKRISGILVTEKGRLVGAINMQDLLRAGVL